MYQFNKVQQQSNQTLLSEHFFFFSFNYDNLYPTLHKYHILLFPTKTLYFADIWEPDGEKWLWHCIWHKLEHYGLFQRLGLITKAGHISINVTCCLQNNDLAMKACCRTPCIKIIAVYLSICALTLDMQQHGLTFSFNAFPFPMIAWFNTCKTWMIYCIHIFIVIHIYTILIIHYIIFYIINKHFYMW